MSTRPVQAASRCPVSPDGVRSTIGSARRARGDAGALEDRHVEEMLALVKLTEPGPFAPRTIEMGNYGAS